MDALEVALFLLVGLLALVGRSRAFSSVGRVVVLFGLLANLVGIAFLYHENIGITFASFSAACQGLTPPDWCTIPMTTTFDSHKFPIAFWPFILVILIDAFAMVG